MVEHDRIYVYTGSEIGYTAGHWYYWDGSAWTDGGVYNSTAVQTDTTLAISGMAADAKATGDAIDGLDARLDTAEDDITDVKSDLKSVIAAPSIEWTVGKYINTETGSIGNSSHYAITQFIPVCAGDTIDNTATPTKDSGNNSLNLYMHCYTNGVWQSRIGMAHLKTTIPSGIDSIRFMFGGSAITMSEEIIAEYFKTEFYTKPMSYQESLDLDAMIKEQENNAFLFRGVFATTDDIDNCLSMGNWMVNINIPPQNWPFENASGRLIVFANTATATSKYTRVQVAIKAYPFMVKLRCGNNTTDWGQWYDLTFKPDLDALQTYIDDVSSCAYSNLFNMDELLQASGWVKSGENYTGTLSNLNSYFGPLAGRGITVYNGFKPNTRYSVNLSAYLPIASERETEEPYTYGLVVTVKYTDSTTRKMLFRFENNADECKPKWGTTDANRTVEKIFLTYTANPEKTWTIREMTVVEGDTAKIYHEYKRTAFDIDSRKTSAGNTLFAGDFFTVKAEDVAAYCPAINAPTTVPADYYSEFISDTWDTLLDDYTDVVTKEQVIMDSSNTYPIYRYVITPEQYDKTVFLSAGCHGPEFGGFWGLYRFIRLMMDKGYKYPNLRRIRNRVRFVIIPIWNPWGVQNSSRNCSLGYEPNGNFPNTIGDRDYDSSGRAAFTCNEAMSIKLTFDSFNPDYWMDLHTDPYGHNYGGYAYSTKGETQTKAVIGYTRDFHEYLRDVFNNNTDIYYSLGGPAYGSNIAGYGNVIRQTPTNVVEVSEDVVSNWKTSSDFTKICVEWYGGVLAEIIGFGVL